MQNVIIFDKSEIMRSTTKLRNIVEQLGAHVNELAAAPYFPAQVHMADHIYRTIGELYQELEHFLKTASHQPPPLPRRRTIKEISSKPAALPNRHSEHEHDDQQPELKGQPFKKMTIAEAARVLLKERGVLHGREIEQLLKQGGYPTASEHFQSTMNVAFKRDGGIENIGRNRWRLKPSSSNSNGKVEVGQAERKEP
ncbi:hypothetical protein [Candidatus Binatus sp.]|uniref:hypothetical protein n=1 Tax=Candidatus Binatus sp. TaxID=2811406 RepID=UPI003C712CFC